MTPEAPKTLLDACRYYADLKVTFHTMIVVKWPDGKICCPKCNGDKIGVIGSRSLYACRGCRAQFSVRSGTLFEDSAVPLGKWLVAVWCVATGDKISSPILADAIEVTQKTAWSMLNRVRVARHLTQQRIKSKARRTH
jgi:transposase-like protein